MAITKRIRIMCWATSDNINQQFTLDLLHDPYWVGSAQPGCVGVANWFSDRSPAGTLPTGVVVIQGCDSATKRAGGDDQCVGHAERVYP